jgi:hypothetical protein
VRIDNLPDVQNVRAHCAATTTSLTVASGNSEDIAVSGGAYSGTLTVALNAESATAATSATRYRCWLQVQVRSAHTGSSVWLDFAGNRTDVYPTVTGQSLASLTGEVGGPLR